MRDNDRTCVGIRHLYWYSIVQTTLYYTGCPDLLRFIWSTGRPKIQLRSSNYTLTDSFGSYHTVAWEEDYHLDRGKVKIIIYFVDVATLKFT